MNELGQWGGLVGEAPGMDLAVRVADEAKVRASAAERHASLMSRELRKRTYTSRDYVNPWKLTPREVEIMDLYVQAGSQVEVAAAIGIAAPTVEAHFANIRRKMGGSNSLTAALAWDRWRRGVKS